MIQLPTAHPREGVTRKADQELEGFVLDLMKKHTLTYAEAFSLLAIQVHRLSSMCLSAERRT